MELPATSRSTMNSNMVTQMGDKLKVSLSPKKLDPIPSTLFSFAGDSMPSYIVQSFLKDCLLYPKIILHKDFQFFRDYLTSIGLEITCSNGIYVENHEDRFFCVELDKKLLKEILHREDFLPEEGAWSSVTRLEVRKKLGLGIWRWDMPKGIMAILQLFISFCKLHFSSFKLNPEMEYFQKFLSRFSFERGFEAEEIYFYEKADEIRKTMSGYVSPVWLSSDDDESNDDASVSSVEFFDSDFNPKKRYSTLKSWNGKGKPKKKIKKSNSPLVHRKSKTKGGSNQKSKLTVLRCPQCGDKYKYRTALNKHIAKAHRTTTNSSTSSCVRKLKFDDSDDDVEPSDSEIDSDSSCQIVYTNFETMNNSTGGKRFSTLRTPQGRSTVRHQLKEIVNDLNIRKTNSSKNRDGSNAKKNTNTNNSLKKQRSKPIQCSHCPTKYQYRSSLAKHIRNCHTSKSVKTKYT